MFSPALEIFGVGYPIFGVPVPRRIVLALSAAQKALRGFRAAFVNRLRQNQRSNAI